MQHGDLRTLLEFIYLGTCSVQRDSLETVVALAAELEMSGFFEDLKVHLTVKKNTVSTHEANYIKPSPIPPEIQTVQIVQVNLHNSDLTASLVEPHRNTTVDNKTSMLPLTLESKQNENTFEDIGVTKELLCNPVNQDESVLDISDIPNINKPGNQKAIITIKTDKQDTEKNVTVVSCLGEQDDIKMDSLILSTEKKLTENPLQSQIT